MSNGAQGPATEDGEAGTGGRMTRNAAARRGADSAGAGGQQQRGSGATKSRALDGPSAIALVKVDDISVEVLEAERNRMSSERAHTLGAIARTHNTLVKELFHLNQYTEMCNFNPVSTVSDTDDSYKKFVEHEGLDLVSKIPSSEGPSKQTRRAYTEKLKMLNASATLLPTTSSASTRRRKGSIDCTIPTAAMSAPVPRANGKGKGRATQAGTDEYLSALLQQTSLGQNYDAIVSALPPPTSSDGSTTRRRPNGGISSRKTNFKEDEKKVGSTSGLALEPQDEGGRSNTVARKSSRIDETTNQSATHPSSKRKPPQSTRPASREQVEEDPERQPLSSVKRIKLIVRRSEPVYTSPAQLPPPQKFNSSVTQFLESYIQPFGKDMSEEAVAKHAVKEARIREKEYQFRMAGRFIPGTQYLFGTVIDANEEPTEYLSPVRTSRDVWDDVMEDVEAKVKTRQKYASKTLGQQITFQIATKVRAYWDGVEVKKQKAREAEDRRLRALAKSTMKLVVGQWRRAVHHIREKQRQEEEEEELRRGHAHLDALLDQSGQLLGAQQGDLYRSRSESIDGWGSDTEEEDEDEYGGQEGAASTHQEEGMTGEEEDVLDDEQEMAITSWNGEREVINFEVDPGPPAGFPSHLSSPSSPTSASTGSEDEEDERDDDDDDGISTRQLVFGQSLEQSAAKIGEDSDDDSMYVSEVDEVTRQPADSTPTKLPESAPYAEQGPAVGEEDMPTVDDDAHAHAAPSVVDIEMEDREQESTATVAKEYSEEGPEKDTSAKPLPEHTSVRDAQPATSSAVDPAAMTLGEDVTSALRDAEVEDEREEETSDEEDEIPAYLRPYAVARVPPWDSKVTHPLLLRGVLRPYQQSGLEWLASLHTRRVNGILADDMGLGKTIQTIALLAHLACDHGVWGPHLIIVPTSVLLNWEMEFKKFLPGFKVISYHGSTTRRKELRKGWNDKHHFNVCITSYTLVTKDAHIFRRKAWYYMILDEAHMIKNFKSQRWNVLLMFRSFRRLLLTGTPLQNNLTELWALLQFLMSGSNFANLKEFGEWFSNPLERAIEMGSILDDENLQRVHKLHTVLRPYLLRRLKRDVEKELPSKHEHLTLCPLSKRQRFLYDEFMSRAQTRDALASGVYQKIANILMQLRKVCNHPDLFETRPIVTSFAMPRSAVADFEIKDFLIRRRMVRSYDLDERDGFGGNLDLGVLGLRFMDRVGESLEIAREQRRLDETAFLPYFGESETEAPTKDLRTIEGFRKYSAYLERARKVAKWAHAAYLNRLKCSRPDPILPGELLGRLDGIVRRSIVPFSEVDTSKGYLDEVYAVNRAVKSYVTRAEEMAPFVGRFAFVTPAAVALDLPRFALAGYEDTIHVLPSSLDAPLHQVAVKLQIAFPDPSLLQYDCGKLQRLAELLRERHLGGHRVLIFTQMTRVLDILEVFLNFHGYLYLRLDGATKIEDRQYITERFNADPRVFCFISSSRSGGVGINLTGADTVVFYDSDFNPQMDRQCEDRAHRIGQIRDVHIYRFVSQYTVEEAMLLKANQKRSLDDIVIQKGEFDWRTLFNEEGQSALTKALGEVEDVEDHDAAAAAEREEFTLVGADEDDFRFGEHGTRQEETKETAAAGDNPGEDDDEEEGGTIVDYMVSIVERNWDFFKEWRV